MVSTRWQTRANPKAEQDYSCIDALGDDLLLYVFELLDSTSRPALFVTTLVSKRWHALAQKTIDSHIGPLTIGKMTRKSNQKLLDRLEQDVGFRRRVRRISIDEWYLAELDLHVPDEFPILPDRDGPFEAEEYFSDTWSEASRRRDEDWRQLEALADLIPKLSLLSFTWTCNPILPEILSSALATQADCKISILRNDEWLHYAQFCYTPYLNQAGLSHLSHIANRICALRVAIPAADSVIVSQLGRLAWSARSLRALEVYAIGQMWIDALVPEALESTKYSRFQTITDLDWLRKPATLASSDVLRVFTLELSNVCVCHSANAIEVLELFDLRRLGNLSLSCVTLLELICEKTSSLHSVKFHLSTSNDFEYSLCAGSNPSARGEASLKKQKLLRNLHLINGTSIITSDLLTSCGTELRSLHLHEHTQWGSLDTLSDLLSEETIHLIGQACTELTELAVDVPYSDKKYREYLNIISSCLQDLCTLRVYREIEFPGTDVADPPRSAVTTTSVQADLERLRPLLPHLGTFEVAVTCLPSFDTSRIWREQGVGIKSCERTLIAQASPFCVAGQCVAVDVHCPEVDIARKAVVHEGGGPNEGFWYWLHDRGRELAENAWDFYHKDVQY